MRAECGMVAQKDLQRKRDYDQRLPCLQELNLEELYKNYEQNAFDEIIALKHTVKEVPWEVFEIFLKKIFKRSK